MDCRSKLAQAGNFCKGVPVGERNGLNCRFLRLGDMPNAFSLNCMRMGFVLDGVTMSVGIPSVAAKDGRITAGKTEASEKAPISAPVAFINDRLLSDGAAKELSGIYPSSV